MKRKDFSKLKLNIQKEKEIYFEHEDYVAGIAPFLRGINSTMDVNNSWRINIQPCSTVETENGIAIEVKLSYVLTKAMEHLKTSISEGNDIDAITSTFSLSWTLGMDHFSEISALRAARMLWSKIVKKYNPKKQKSLALKIHCKTADLSLNEENPYHILTRHTIATMTARLGSTQSIDATNIEMKNSEPVEFSNDISCRTQQFIQEETSITKTIDPWAGSTFVEKRTEEIAYKTWELILKIEELGGFTTTIKKGFTKK